MVKEALYLSRSNEYGWCAMALSHVQIYIHRSVRETSVA